MSQVGVCFRLCIFGTLVGALLAVGPVISVTVDHKLGLYIILGVLLLPYLCYCCSWICVSSPDARPNPVCCRTCIYLLLVTILSILPVSYALRVAYDDDKRVDFEVAGSTLTQFNLTNNHTTLNYNLSLNVTVGPNHKGAGVCFEKLQAWGNYRGNNFTSLTLHPFFLGGKKMYSLYLVFIGRRDDVVLVGDGLKRYQQEAAAGRFDIDVTLSFLGFRTHNVSDCNFGSEVNGTLVDKAPVGGHHQVKGVATLELKDVPLTSHNGTT